MRLYNLLALEDQKNGFTFHEGRTSQGAPLSEGLRFYFATLRSHPVTEREAYEDLLEKLAQHPLKWLKPGRKYWTVNLDGLAAQIPDRKRQNIPKWFTGTIAAEPIFEVGDVTDIDKPNRVTWRGYICFDIKDNLEEPNGLTRNTPRNPLELGSVP